MVVGPREAVFQTAELLEHILMLAAGETLFAVQHISCHFRDLVATSPQLQDRLLMRPPTSMEA